jgi:16S rRNA (cytosine1402-N4)-methyltransferase
LDLGIASPHVDHADRGFSFIKDGPLDMRIDHEADETAEEIINNWSQEDLTKIFRDYGEEKYSHKIARLITEYRSTKPIQSTKELADLILAKMHKKERIHPATRVFQAIRIAVNKELDNLKKAIEDGLELLNPKGRMSIISYHSLEDRIVKEMFKEAATPITQETIYSVNDVIEPAKFHILTKKPITPSPEEVQTNPRSRSAKLRILEKI